VALSADGQLALSGGNDTTTRLWQVQTGTELAQMVAFEDGEWVTITSTGFYVASPNGDQYVNVRVKGNQVRGIEDYKALYYRPSDAVQLALQGQTPQSLAPAQTSSPLPPPK